MSSTRIAPIPFWVNGEQDRSRATISAWLYRYTTKYKHTLQDHSHSADLIEITHARQLAVRDTVFERHLPFAWSPFILGLISLALVFSDVPRSGVGVANVEDIYPPLQPDETMGFGTSWNYSVFSATRADAFTGKVKARVWSYKFDSTSIIWRVFAELLGVAGFPECFSYSRKCSHEYFGSDVAFTLIDALVDAIQNGSNVIQRASNSTPIGLTIRSENEYIDRLHQFLLPNWFTNINWRTNQALYYSPTLLATMDSRAICFPPNSKRIQKPQFCSELWINFNKSCAPADTESRAVGLLYVHTLSRLRDIETRFPNFTVDLTFLVSQEDQQVSRGGLSWTGFRRSDVSTIIRARRCINVGAPGSCETMFVEDYRYETGLLVSDIVQWYRLLAALRIIGQSYFFLRGMGLVLSCYFIHATPAQKDLSRWERVQKARRLLVKVPTQCVVYGSSFPVLCYVLAHVIDAPFTYQVLEGRFFTQSGILYLPLRLFISYVVVQMRNVWVYALVWHIVMTVRTSSWIVRGNQLSDGILGVPSFFLSAISSVTLFAQYRMTSFRSSKVLRMVQIPSNTGAAWGTAKYQYNFAPRGRGNVLLGGVIIDFKFLVCVSLTLGALWTAHELLFPTLFPGKSKHKRQHSAWLILASTPVPYSAGVLWPSTSMSVHWPANFFCIRDEQTFRAKHQILRFLLQNAWLLRWSRIDRRIAPFAFTAYLQNQSAVPTKDSPNALSGCSKSTTFRYIQHQMKCSWPFRRGRGECGVS